MSLNILIIDDEFAIAHALAVRLMACGCTVSHAPSGRGGLALAKQSQPDAIVLDIRLPDCDGFEVCDTLRSGRDPVRTPIVFVTAQPQEHYRTLALATGGDGFFPKPYQFNELWQTIQALTAFTNH